MVKKTTAILYLSTIYLSKYPNYNMALIHEPGHKANKLQFNNFKPTQQG